MARRCSLPGFEDLPLFLQAEEVAAILRVSRSLTVHTIRDWLTVACREADLTFKSPHCLRHTFCSHLAMRGAPVRSIQELAGHSDLQTTQRYMHLTPAALEGAIRLLDQPSPRFGKSAERERGDIVETV